MGGADVGGVCFVYPSPVWVGGLPFVLVMLPACVYVLASCRGRRLWIWAGVWTVLSVSVAFRRKCCYR